MFVHRLSKFFVHENASSSSSDEQLIGFTEHDDLQYIDYFCEDGSKTDKRFLNLFKVMNRLTS